MVAPSPEALTPPAEVRAANHDFNKDSVVCDMAALDFRFLSQAKPSLAATQNNRTPFRPFVGSLARLINVVRNISGAARRTPPLSCSFSSRILCSTSAIRARPICLRNRYGGRYTSGQGRGHQRESLATGY